MQEQWAEQLEVTMHLVRLPRKLGEQLLELLLSFLQPCCAFADLKVAELLERKARVMLNL